MLNSKPRLTSLFDVLGPVMTGPSSSHTAGVLRIGRMGRQFLGGDPDSIELRFYGALAHTYKGHLSDSGIVGGLIGMKEDSPEIRDALSIAHSRSIPVTCVTAPESTLNPNTVDMRLKKGEENLKVVGISIGRGEILMTELDDFPLRLYGNEDLLLLVADRTLSENEFRTLLMNELTDELADEFLGFDTAEKNGRVLHACFLKNTPSPELEAKAKGLPGVERVYSIASIYDYKLVNPESLFDSFAELLRLCDERGASIADMAAAYEACRSGLTRDGTMDRMAQIWKVMKASAEAGLTGENRLVAGLVRGDNCARLMQRVVEGKNISGPIVGAALARALAVMETNGCMGCIAAAPTAGACGVLSGCLLTLAENLKSKPEEIYEALLAAAVVGVLIAMRAPVSGALGGCQSEIGVASAMTAASMAHLGGGSPSQTIHAAALALKNILGLICDPVAGPVEIPCIKRNGIGVGNAFAAADMALAGIESAIPPDEVVDALINVQTLLPRELRGTLIGGLASTPTAKRLKRKWDEILAERQQ